MIVRNLFALALTLFLSGGVSAKSQDYDIYEDWQKHGYVFAIEDTGPMSMSFRTTAAPRDVYLNSLRIFPRAGFFIQSKFDSKDTMGVSTDWKTLPVSGFTSFVSGYTGVRVRFVVMVYPLGLGSNIQARADMEVSENDAWKSQSSTELRNQVRLIVSSILARPIYGDYDEVQTLVQSYLKGDVTIATKDEFWKTYSLSGFKPIAPPESLAQAQTAPIQVAPLPSFRLVGSIKMREILRLGSPPLTLSLAQDESGTKAIQWEIGGKTLIIPQNDFIVLAESAKAAQSRKGQLAPGDSELSKELDAGADKLQFGAKATVAKLVSRLLVVAQPGGAKIELQEADSTQLLAALERARGFLLGKEELSK